MIDFAGNPYIKANDTYYIYTRFEEEFSKKSGQEKNEYVEKTQNFLLMFTIVVI